jgi:hypothetical protein
MKDLFPFCKNLWLPEFATIIGKIAFLPHFLFKNHHIVTYFAV